MLKNTGLFFISTIYGRMKKKPILTQVEDEGVIIEIELPSRFIDFYKKETGHSNITKKGIAKFLNNLIRIHQNII